MEVQNYIDNTGVQVADVVAGMLHLPAMWLEAEARHPGRFDYQCWDLYAAVSKYYDEHPEALAMAPRCTARYRSGRRRSGEESA